MNDSKNAFIVLQIDKNEYISASLVLAYSLRRSFVREDLIIMVNDKISLKCLDILKKVYDKVIEINKISNKMSINKLVGLQFDEYDKVALIDSDCIIFKNIDFIFDYKTPSMIKDSTGLIVIKPDKNKLKSIKKSLLKKNYELTELLKENYKKIYKIDSKVLESNNYDKKSYGIQFNKNKPFILESEISLEERIKWKHFNMWYYFFRNVLNDNFDISLNSCIKQVIDLSKNYLSNMIEFVLENENILRVRNKEIIKEVYDLKKDKLDNELNSYHTGISLNYKSKELIYDNNDYIFKDFISYYNKIKNVKLKKYTNISDFLSNENEENIESFLNLYIRYDQNIFIILQTNEINKDCEKDIPNINLIYKKKFVLNGDVLKNVLFEIDSRYTYKIRLENMKNIKNNVKYNLILRICENLVNTDVVFNEYKNNVLIVNDTSSKVVISSILLNNNSLEKYVKKDIYFLNKKDDKINIKARLIKETIKKWIYNNYSVEEIEKIFIKFDKKITIYEFFKNKIICEEIPEIFNIKKNYSSKEFYKLLNNKNNKYYEIDGIKYI